MIFDSNKLHQNVRPKISRKMCPKWNCEGFRIRNNLQSSLSRVMRSLILLLKPSSYSAMAPSAPSYFGAYRRFSVAALNQRARFARTGHTWLEDGLTKLWLWNRSGFSFQHHTLYQKVANYDLAILTASLKHMCFSIVSWIVAGVTSVWRIHFSQYSLAFSWHGQWKLLT